MLRKLWYTAVLILVSNGYCHAMIWSSLGSAEWEMCGGINPDSFYMQPAAALVYSLKVAAESREKIAIKKAKTDYANNLWVAVKYGNEQRLKELLNVQSLMDKTTQALLPTLVADTVSKGNLHMMALEFGFYGLVHLLLKAGANVNSVDKYGFYSSPTPLHQVATRYNKCLQGLSFDWSLGLQKYKEESVQRYQKEIPQLVGLAQILVEAPGVDFGLVDKHNQTALQIAGNSVIGDLIRQKQQLQERRMRCDDHTLHP